ncbi:DNA replication protein [Tanacetum coccineum]
MRNEKSAPEILLCEALFTDYKQIPLKVEETVEELMQNGEDPLTIEKFMFHIQKTADLWARLSTQEQKFARRSIEDMKQHFEQSVLSNLPERYNSHSKSNL